MYDFKWKDIHGKKLEMHYGVDYAPEGDMETEILMGLDRKTGKTYIFDIKIKRRTEEIIPLQSEH